MKQGKAAVMMCSMSNCMTTKLFNPSSMPACICFNNLFTSQDETNNHTIGLQASLFKLDCALNMTVVAYMHANDALH